ncbi:gamma-glutamyl-gamma-aminobutyrate hydrolase family protein [Alienimonas californiensis]|uniref:Glutamine amidotransferase n=1 Tax=Alienimonas californiensis TaxID=2527989 RepID=A0A517P5R6_9PLAN|nr:gamma-glutamyl-gamma-aminobutyrate hydrolase family protein [Alienimonas californiensis]QDT14728.1 Putative glutamine amidotransferase [Alienimonas californiensis]
MTRRTFLAALGLVLVGGLGGPAGWLSTAGAQSLRLAPERLPVADAAATPAERPVRRPVIGIASLTGDTYVRAIRDAGGVPVVLPNVDGSPDAVEDYLELLDGLLMPGGADIPPSEWGEAPHPTTKVLDDDRYQFEKALISAWIERTDKPLLGICLGSQWVNVAHGGSLVQDIPSEFGVVHRDVTHPVTLEPDSRLAKVFGCTSLEVNSYHHQAVRDVGKGLRVVARSPDGVIEATETTDPDRFLIGVQWHPEKLAPEDPLQRKLLAAFIEAASQEEE